MSTIILDWSDGQPAGFTLEVTEVTQEEFTIRYTAVTPKMIYGIKTVWAAFNDPSIQVVTYQSSNVGELNSGVNKERSQLAVVKFKEKFEEVPEVATFITGVQFTNGNNAIRTSLYEVKKDCATIEVGTYYTTKLEYYQLTLVVGPSKYLYTGELSYRVASYDEPIAKFYQYTDRLVDLEDEVTDVK